MDRLDYVLIGDRMDTAGSFLESAMDFAADAEDEEIHQAIEVLMSELADILEKVRERRDSFPAPEFEYEYTFSYEYRATGTIRSPISRNAISDEDLESLAMRCEEEMWSGPACPGSLEMCDWDCEDVRKVPVKEARE